MHSFGRGTNDPCTGTEESGGGGSAISPSVEEVGGVGDVYESRGKGRRRGRTEW